MKKYKLLKDLPDLKAGAIFTREYEDMPFYYGRGGPRIVHTFEDDYVENNPEWFEEVKEDASKNLYNELSSISYDTWRDSGTTINLIMTYIKEHYIEKDKIREALKNSEIEGLKVDAYRFGRSIEELIK